MSMTVLNLPQLLNPTFWSYVSEGTANLCVRYQGPELAYDIQRRYAEEIIRPLLGPSVVPPSLLVRVHHDFLQELGAIILPQRPVHRRNQDILTSQAHATLMPDLIMLSADPSLSLEIKPKWGFIPRSRNITEDRIIKRSICRHCLKTRCPPEGKSPTSSYCPMDLYSGDPVRILRGLTSLSADPPSNRLVFFRDGRVIALCHSVLPSTFPLGKLTASLAWSIIWDAMTTALAACPFLSHLKRHQERLYGLSIEGALALYEDPAAAKAAKNAWGSMDAWKEALNAYLSRDPSKDDELLSKMDHIQTKVHRLLQQCMAATLQDLSIMITLHPGPLPSASLQGLFPSTYIPILTHLDTHELEWHCRVSAIDLDPKPVTRIPHWDDLDRKIALSATVNSPTFSCTPSS
ncbi:inositol-pentakisphosphate 2-kinase [Piptocephalis cylindrospora]|uniref:Inositol-pentakisphosphate 2-kinase n=1 Tax=Piptocephalis cylindrospora TaxID=1907219 RepID=A0A4P9Y078_9FUNG|nr:inositol-pentakisphosphate 2-kinase [Piptocephalis cylindrospora]|eukprot:RKP12135.1 inositol-pentakisphosphate 2-kinase [Piptocephalis cylindrospora]